VLPLERAVGEFPGDRRAAVAAFTLGLVEADHLGRPDRAIVAFRRSLELGPPAALDEDAWGRLAETYGRVGRYDEARDAAGEYLRRHPGGSRAATFRRWVSSR
jgi:tetratricopeptide (TPR) repeat protein